MLHELYEKMGKGRDYKGALKPHVLVRAYFIIS
jgi:hypothetical protein